MIRKGPCATCGKKSYEILNFSEENISIFVCIAHRDEVYSEVRRYMPISYKYEGSMLDLAEYSRTYNFSDNRSVDPKDGTPVEYHQGRRYVRGS